MLVDYFAKLVTKLVDIIRIKITLFNLNSKMKILDETQDLIFECCSIHDNIHRAEKAILCCLESLPPDMVLSDKIRDDLKKLNSLNSELFECDKKLTEYYVKSKQSDINKRLLKNKLKFMKEERDIFLSIYNLEQEIFLDLKEIGV